ncbi:integrase [Microvirga flocculans]|uniref:Integrase n=1 Tax=Microvirga flocculans TaxID=217168 RepID=A0A7W6ICT0_9HYPH|nr:tyrosine-type recombinase/integrase [Microvirga flocculans]MBB4039087.1 integrase [Microvirga flocculans]
MSIYPEKRGGKLTGRLRVEVQRNKKTLVKFATSQKEARKLETEMKAGLHDNPDSSVAVTQTNNGLKLLEDQVELQWNGLRSEVQRKQHGRRFVKMLAKVMKDEKLPDDLKALRSIHIHKAVDLCAGDKSAACYNSYMSAASKLLTWAEEQEYVEAVPKLRFRSSARRETFYLTDEDESKLRDTVKAMGWDNIITIMDVQLATGCRISEVLKRTPKDLNDDGDGFYSLYLGVTKNGHERYAVLDTELGKRFADLLEKGLPSYDVVYKRLRSARKTAGLPLTQPTHAHRHTVATRLARENVNAVLLKDFMGHENLQTTMRYIHNDTAQKKQVAKNLIRRPTAAANMGGHR